jgi:DNA-binding Lrp family transcriptional regulator
MDDQDKYIIAHLQGDLALTEKPFAALASDLGLSEEEVVQRIQAMADAGIMRRFGATLRHQRSGFPANVMVAWNVSEDQAQQVGETLATFRQVSHCYWRERCGDFPYNLYSMVHGQSEAECREVVAEMAQATGQNDYALLFSKKELKKTSMRYFEPHR